MVRPEKVAVVEEIQERLTSSDAAVLTEYRGLSVPELAGLRASLRETGTSYKIYKNTLVRRAADAAGIEGAFSELLLGPTAFAFVSGGDVVTAAKALRDFSRSNDSLVIKGALLEGRFISAEQVAELAGLPTRDELVAKVAGAFKAPMYKAAGLFSALQRNTAYALKALIDKRVEAGEEPPPADEPADAAEEASETPAEETAAEEAPGEETAAEEGPAEETAAEESASPPASEAEDASSQAPTGDGPAEPTGEAAAASEPATEADEGEETASG